MIRLYRRFAVPIFWITLAIVYAVAIMPAAKAPDFHAGDKVNHIVAFLTLTMLGRLAYGEHLVGRLALGLSLFGALIELTQAIPALHRDASVWDWVADSCAVLATLTAAWVFERCRPGRRPA